MSQTFFLFLNHFWCHILSKALTKCTVKEESRIVMIKECDTRPIYIAHTDISYIKCNGILYSHVPYVNDKLGLKDHDYCLHIMW